MIIIKSSGELIALTQEGSEFRIDIAGNKIVRSP